MSGLTALPALAHVTVNAADATQAGFTVLTFRVPTESDTASTTGIKVQFPADQPLAFVSVKPKAGWTYTVTKAKLPTPVKTDDGEVTDYTSVIDWKASTGAGIKPGEFDEFQVSAGPLPKAPSMTFKAIQTYSDGKVVSWIEVPPAGSTTEPDLPAPTLKLATAPAEGSSTTQGGAAAPRRRAARRRTRMPRVRDRSPAPTCSAVSDCSPDWPAWPWASPDAARPPQPPPTPTARPSAPEPTDP